MAKLKSPSLLLSKSHYSKLIEIARQQAPFEACGIIAGIGQTSQKIYPISNILKSTVEYLMNPEEMVHVFWEIENQHWEPIAFFHSHPASLPFPSQTDLDRNYYPETPHLIIGREEGLWSIRGFLLSKIDYNQIEIQIT